MQAKSIALLKVQCKVQHDAKDRKVQSLIFICHFRYLMRDKTDAGDRKVQKYIAK